MNVQKTFLGRMLPMARLCKDSGISRSMMMQTSLRSFSASTAYQVKSKFEEAYNAKMADINKLPPKR